jgi:hypothetical protein
VLLPALFLPKLLNLLILFPAYEVSESSSFVPSRRLSVGY